MQTLYYPAFNELVVTDRPVPELTDHEVLIEVAACGICGSELESFSHQSAKRTPPIIMGHEFCGVITQVGKQVRRYKVGDEVVSNAIVSCNACSFCTAGKTNLCTNRQVFSIHRNGAFGQYVNVPESCLLAWPPGLPAEQACLAEPLANGVHMVSLTKHLSAKQVLIIGAGPIGLMAQQAFQALRGASCYVSDINEHRLEVASDLGAALTINPSTENLEELILQATDGLGVDLVVDAVGNQHTTTQAIKVVKPGSTVVLIGLQQNTQVLNSYDLITAEKQVIGSYAATQEDIRTALQLMADKKVDVHSWVHTYALKDGVKGFMDMLGAKDGHIKSVLVPTK